MSFKRFLLVGLFCLFLIPSSISAQVFVVKNKVAYNPDSVRRELEKAPYFSLFKDNYFAGGTSVGSKPTVKNSNVKFQISISQRLTKSQLPFDTYLFVAYTQKNIWNVFEESLPMQDMNFNPGIGLGHLIIRKNKYIGKAYFMIEHESNGKDSILSRSWNKVTLATSLMISNNFELQLKAWVPIIDSGNNKDILTYNGLGQTALNYMTDNGRLRLATIITWRKKFMRFNSQWEISYKLSRKENQFLFLQYYNGYGENLLDYNKFKSIVRIGFVIKPEAFSFY